MIMMWGCEMPKKPHTKRKTISIQLISISLMFFVICMGIMFMDRINTIKYEHARDIEMQENEYNASYQNYLENKFSVIERVTKFGYEKAQFQGLIIQNEILERIQMEYGDDTEAIKNDLDNILNNQTDSKMAEILKDSIEGKFIYDIKNDNNDPFIAMVIDDELYILTDLSLNCSANEGRARTAEEEASMHFNENAARILLSNIKNHSQDKNVWIFLEPVTKIVKDGEVVESIEEPFYKDLEELDIVTLDALEDIYYQYDGNVDIFKYPEFIYTNYIHRREDIVGRPLVNNFGIKQNDSAILIINNGFNTYDILQELELDEDLDKLENDIKKTESRLQEYKDVKSMKLENDISREVYRFIFIVIFMLALVIIMAGHNNRQLEHLIKNKQE